VLQQGPAHRVGVLFPEPGGALDVREEKGNRSAWKVAHDGISRSVCPACSSATCRAVSCQSTAFHHLAATGRSLEELTALLGCTLETLDHLRLCWPPRAERWEPDLSELAEKIGVDREALAERLG
jgi:hypothetical protein